MTRALLAAVTIAIAAAAPAADERPSRPARVQSFKPVATFNVPDGTSAEIVSATPDGRTLIYSDAIGERFGKVDVSNVSAPVAAGFLDVSGSPTSVAVLPDGIHAVGAVQPGRLLLIDVASLTVAGEKAIGAGVDSVAVTTIDDQIVAVVAIENEGALPKGYVEVVRLNLADFASSPSALVTFDDEAQLTAAGLLAPDDPQPEYVDIFGKTAAITLQENNGIALIDISDPAEPRLESLFSAGIASERRADLLDDSTIAFTQHYPTDALAEEPTAGARIPDAVGWNRDGTMLFTADEGEENFQGGRGWSVRHASGGFARDDGGTLERTAVRLGHYPDGRSDAKGIEAEGLTVATFGGREFLFVTSERGAFVAVYRVQQDHTTFVQLLATGQGPESVITIPSRNLLVTANEGDDGNGSISLFRGVDELWEPPRARPRIESSSVREPWGALSGLAASAFREDVLYAVPDSALPSSIFEIRTGKSEAPIRELVPVSKDGVQQRYDLEGITLDSSIRKSRRAGYWLASEGDGAASRNILVQVDRAGDVLREVFLPPEVDLPSATDLITANGFEGVTVSGDGRYLLVAVQRPYRNQPRVDGVEYTRIARYDLLNQTWDAFFYPLDNFPGTIGLSEIALVGRTSSGADVYAVIERDNQLAFNANLKRVYTFTVDRLAPVGIAEMPTAALVATSGIRKTLKVDLLRAFTPYEKVEGLTRTRDGDWWVVLDNDGGEFESRLFKFRD
jgi:hypothetical protein